MHGGLSAYIKCVMLVIEVHHISGRYEQIGSYGHKDLL